MPENPNPKTGTLPRRRRRYRTRMFDKQLSFPTTSAQVRQLQAESDAEQRSVTSLVREAIDQFLPRLRKRRRKRRANPDERSAASPRTGISFQGKIVRRLLGEPTRIVSAREWCYGSLRIDLKDGLCRDCKTNQVCSILKLIQRELQIDQHGALAWMERIRKEPPE